MGPGEEDDRCVSSNFGDKVGGVCITLGAKDGWGIGKVYFGNFQVS